MRQTNRDLTACVTSEISCLLQSNIDAFQNLTTVLREGGPGLGQCRPPNIANQERYVQLAFQSRHRLRDRRLCDTKTKCCAQYASGVSHGNEVLKPAQVQ